MNQRILDLRIDRDALFEVHDRPDDVLDPPEESFDVGERGGGDVHEVSAQQWNVLLPGPAPEKELEVQLLQFRAGEIAADQQDAALFRVPGESSRPRDRLDGRGGRVELVDPGRVHLPQHDTPTSAVEAIS